MEKIINQNIQKKIKALYDDSRRRGPFIPKLNRLKLKGIGKISYDFQPKDFKNHYLAISQKQGEHIFNLITENNFKNIVEFGTSFGISTLFLAAAAEKTKGNIITSELLAEKAGVARQNFIDAGVNELIDLRVGDAIDTLSKGITSVDFLVLDGWKDLYLPILKQLEEKLSLGSMVYVDNANMAGVQPTLDYISNSPNFSFDVFESGKVVLATRIK